MKISLTFDNGPDPETTPFVLDILKSRKVPATFFQVGKNLASQAAATLADRILGEGHRIGNHSFTHSTPLGLCSEDVAVDEIARTQESFAMLGVETRLFRPFGGGGNLNRELLHPAAVRYLTEYAMTCVTWNCVPRDWVDPHHWAERALADVCERDWSVVVIHDLPARGMEHLPGFLEEARTLGAEFMLEFPDDCVPIRDGRIMWDLSHLLPPDAGVRGSR